MSKYWRDSKLIGEIHDLSGDEYEVLAPPDVDVRIEEHGHTAQFAMTYTSTQSRDIVFRIMSRVRWAEVRHD